jgi:hypothetical protein
MPYYNDFQSSIIYFPLPPRQKSSSASRKKLSAPETSTNRKEAVYTYSELVSVDPSELDDLSDILKPAYRRRLYPVPENIYYKVRFFRQMS